MPTHLGKWSALLLIPALGVGLLAPPPARADEPADAFFENQVRPLLVKACQECHGAKKQRSSLRVDSRAALVRGGDGGPAIVPGEPAKSLLIEAVGHKSDLRMPPKAKLTDAEVAILTRWVQIGAPWPGETQPAALRSGAITDKDRQFWSFQPVRKTIPPPGNGTEIDRFIGAHLEAKGLKPAARADSRTLLRRMYFDLIGLPPTPEEVDDFTQSAIRNSQYAIEQVVDRLLASPHYGERWGRHWLDVVRYADTAGETADFPVPQAYQYRNYVIDAFNADKPYDVFLREQIAGDILAAQGPPEKYAERVIATGFLAISRRFGFDPENYQHLTIQDTLDTVGQSVLGLTVGCARCHDHKYDPVMREDYYALYGIFNSTRYPYPGSENRKQPVDFAPLLPPEGAASLKSRFDAEVAALNGDLKKLEEEKKVLAAEMARPTIAASLPLKERLAELDGELIQQKRRLDELNQAGPYPLAYAVSEGKSANARVHKRGEPRDLGDEVPRRFLEILGGDRLPPDVAGSGRLALADWLTRPANPLTARVMVNRIWQHHFGTGLVATPNDFGARGARPSHPELLDWLADRFVRDGWSVKKMHRLIMLSAAYQRGDASDPRAAQIDPDNRLLWRANRRRLDAESIRDAMLAISGKLDTTTGGPHPFPPVKQWGFTQHAPFTAVYETKRRSVYLMTQRLKRHPFLALFDGADTNASTPQRGATTVPTQALFLMNDPFVHEQADAFAARLMALRTDDGGRINLAYQFALGRPPSTDELRDVGQFLDAYRQRLATPGVAATPTEGRPWAALARTLFARNEFLFVE
ncbi:hypothetical protein AYO44_04470 [Planctomycetaceae bacterium SCGC AG-212-F19]|nr:hypothetical protein AYO44_04470 [Planctomycetaceae bacterium SCGC AG-212-F19]